MICSFVTYVLAIHKSPVRQITLKYPSPCVSNRVTVYPPCLCESGCGVTLTQSPSTQLSLTDNSRTSQGEPAQKPDVQLKSSVSLQIPHSYILSAYTRINPSWISQSKTSLPTRIFPISFFAASLIVPLKQCSRRGFSCLLCEAVYTPWLQLIWTDTVPRTENNACKQLITS